MRGGGGDKGKFVVAKTSLWCCFLRYWFDRNSRK